MSVQNHCNSTYFYAPLTNAALFGVAAAVSSINPLGAAITGATSSFGYVMEQWLNDDDDNFHPTTSFVVSRLATYGLGVLAAHALGVSISFKAALLLGLSANLAFVGVATIAIFVTSRLFSSLSERNAYMKGGIDRLAQSGHPYTALAASYLLHFAAGYPIRDILNPIDLLLPLHTSPVRAPAPARAGARNVPPMARY